MAEDLLLLGPHNHPVMGQPATISLEAEESGPAPNNPHWNGQKWQQPNRGSIAKLECFPVLMTGLLFYPGEQREATEATISASLS